MFYYSENIYKRPKGFTDDFMHLEHRKCLKDSRRSYKTPGKINPKNSHYQIMGLHFRTSKYSQSCIIISSLMWACHRKKVLTKLSLRRGYVVVITSYAASCRYFYYIFSEYVAKYHLVMSAHGYMMQNWVAWVLSLYIVVE